MKRIYIILDIAAYAATQWSCKEEIVQACQCNIEYSAPVQTCNCFLYDQPDTTLVGGVGYTNRLNMPHQHYYNGELWNSCGYITYADRERKLNYKWTVENCAQEVIQEMILDSVPRELGEYKLCESCEEGYRAQFHFIYDSSRVDYVLNDAKDNFLKVIAWDTIFSIPFANDSAHVVELQAEYQMNWLPKGERVDSLPREIIISKGKLKSNIVLNVFK